MTSPARHACSYSLSHAWIFDRALAFRIPLLASWRWCAEGAIVVSRVGPGDNLLMLAFPCTKGPGSGLNLLFRASNRGASARTIPAWSCCSIESLLPCDGYPLTSSAISCHHQMLQLVSFLCCPSPKSLASNNLEHFAALLEELWHFRAWRCRLGPARNGWALSCLAPHSASTPFRGQMKLH